MVIKNKLISFNSNDIKGVIKKRLFYIISSNSFKFTEAIIFADKFAKLAL